MEYRIQGGGVVISEFWHMGQLLDTPFTGFDSGTVTRFLKNMLGDNYSVLQSTLLIDVLPKLGQSGCKRNSMSFKIPKYKNFSFGGIFGYDR